MICPGCQAENSDNALRCDHCGAALGGEMDVRDPRGEDVTASSGFVAYSKPPAATRVAAPVPDAGSGGSAPLALAPGTEFGPRYRIECLLGRGGMGAVYKAYDKELNRVVALKLVRPEPTSDASSMRRFKQELLLASKISHKNILRIHDLGDVEGVKFISMAYVEGEDLHHDLEREGRLPLART